MVIYTSKMMTMLDQTVCISFTDTMQIKDSWIESNVTVISTKTKKNG